MLTIDSPGNRQAKYFPQRAARVSVLLVISIGLFVFSEEFSPVNIFEPQSTGWILWFSYAKDLIQPFAFYFLICLGAKWLKTWQSRALLAFIVPTLLEIGQLVYYRFSTGRYVGAFEAMDILMYAIGVGLAVTVEQKFFARMLKFW